MILAGRRSRERPGPGGAPRTDPLDVRWSPDYQRIVTTNPELRSPLLRVARDAWDQGHRAHRNTPNPLLFDPDIAGHDNDARPRGNIMSATPLTIDAKNRAWRTLLVGLVTDVLVAVLLVLIPVITTADGWDDIKWDILWFSLAKTAITTAGSFLLRRFADGSRLPTPLPPTPVPPPADPEPMAEAAAEEYRGEHEAG